MATILIKRPQPKNTKLKDKRPTSGTGEVKKSESVGSVLKKAIPNSLTKIASKWGNSKKAGY
jgi:hypothetical protein